MYPLKYMSDLTDEKINVTVQYYRTYSKLYTVAVTGTVLEFNFFTS